MRGCDCSALFRCGPLKVAAFTPYSLLPVLPQFVQQHVRMEDALLYLRDLLQRYAALQRFTPKPQSKSACYTGAAAPAKGHAGMVALHMLSSLCMLVGTHAYTRPCPYLQLPSPARSLPLDHAAAAAAAALQIPGQRVLQDFGVPFKEDAEQVAKQYPWLTAWDPGCPRLRFCLRSLLGMAC